MLESLLTNRKLDEEGSLSGLPVKKGYMSSRYGWRTDPITGKRAMHNGLDFAGKSGSAVVAVGLRCSDLDRHGVWLRQSGGRFPTAMTTSRVMPTTRKIWSNLAISCARAIPLP